MSRRCRPAQWRGVAAIRIAVGVAMLASCSSNPARPGSPAPTGSAAGTSSGSRPPATASPTPATPALMALAACPSTRALSSITPLARLPGDADDLAVTADGHIWLGLRAQGRLLELDSTGRTVVSLSDPNGPEGIVVLPDGRVAVAEQSANRIDILDPRSSAFHTLAILPRGLGAGVDGIAYDPSRGALLVPNSGAGTLLEVSLGDGAVTTVVSGGLGRPVSAARLADGALLIAVENPPGLLRVSPSGLLVPVVASDALQSLDEVVVLGPNVYVTDLVAGTLDALDPATGRIQILVDGAPAPQGLAVTAGGHLLLTDSTRMVLVSLRGC